MGHQKAPVGLYVCLCQMSFFFVVSVKVWIVRLTAELSMAHGRLWLVILAFANSCVRLGVSRLRRLQNGFVRPLTGNVALLKKEFILILVPVVLGLLV